MATFAEWVESVKIAYQGGEPSRAQILATLKDGVSGIMARDTESDLQLARSYQDRFDKGKWKLAGTRLTGTLATVVTEVRALVPIAADTDAMLGALDNAIEAIRDEFNNVADKFDRFLLEAAIELQRHVPFYRVRQLATYLYDTAGVTHEGYVSTIALPEDARIKQVWYGPYYPPLAEGELVEEEDIVVSNGRLYLCVTGGTLAEYELGDGLLSTDGEEETIGDLVFTFYRGDRDYPARPVEWLARWSLRAGQLHRGPAYTVPEEQDVMWFYPKLDDTHRFDLEYVGIAQSFGDTDEVTFDKVAAKAAAHYIRGMFQQSEENDPRTAQVSLGYYQRGIREAVLDCQDRQAVDGATAPYDWIRNPRVCGSISVSSTGAATGSVSTEYPNAYHARSNSSGDITLEATAPNQTIALAVSGVARESSIILSTEDRSAGDRMIVLMALPATAGIAFEFLNDSAGGTSLLPAAVFPDQQFTTDGETTSAFFEFYYNGTAWDYVGWRSPA